MELPSKSGSEVASGWNSGAVYTGGGGGGRYKDWMCRHRGLQIGSGNPESEIYYHCVGLETAASCVQKNKRGGGGGGLGTRLVY